MTIYNRLSVRPTEETLAYLSSVMSGSPLDLDLSAYTVEVMTTKDRIEANPDNVYNAYALSLKPWYDAYLERSSLLLSLNSEDLAMRCLELHRAGVERAFFDGYFPYLTIRPDMPPLSRNYKTFILTTANTLCKNERPLQFSSEFVEQVDIIRPLNYDYYQAQLALDHNLVGY